MVLYSRTIVGEDFFSTYVLVTVALVAVHRIGGDCARGGKK